MPLDKKIRYAGSLTSTILKRKFDNRKDCGSVFRSSTGILALVFIIADYGHDAEYVICGIGILHRDEYPDGGHIHRRELLQHVFADIEVLRSLARRYHFSTTESELVQFIPRHTEREDLLCGS